MSDIIFAKPVHLYESYSDLWRIVELSGYPIITIGDIDPASDNCYLFSTPDTHWHDGTERRGWPDARARIIYFNIEWYMDVDYSAIPGVEVWSADQWHAEKTNTRYIPLGSHPGLKSYPESPNGKVYDVVTLWASSFNRYRGLGQLREHNVALAPNGWGDERHDSLMRSRVMCHVHQWPDKPTCAPQRFALAAAYGLPMISETMANGGIFTGDTILTHDMDGLGGFVAEWLKHERMAELNQHGAALHELLCVEWGFRKVVEGAV